MSAIRPEAAICFLEKQTSGNFLARFRLHAAASFGIPIMLSLTPSIWRSLAHFWQ